MAAYANDAKVKIRTVRLYGRLGFLFGRVHKLAVSNPAEAVHALGMMIDGFKRYLQDSKSKGVDFAVFVGKKNITQDELRHPPGAEDIRIAPVVGGRKNGGIFSVIAGVVLVVVGAVTGNVPLMLAGGGLMLGGVLMLNSPQQKGLGTDDDAKNRPSYNFNGAVNTAAQGRCVPLAYGEVMCGSAVVSAGIYTEDQQ